MRTPRRIRPGGTQRWRRPLELSYPRETLIKLVAGIRPDQMSNPTPCLDWDVRGLLNHFVGGATMFTRAFHGDDMGRTVKLAIR